MKNFIKTIKGKQILVAGLSVLVIVAGFYRWNTEKNNQAVTVMNELQADMLDNTEENNEQQGIAEDYFAKARYERDCARSEAAELLRVSLNTGENSDELAQKNIDKLEEYASNMEKETAIENMVIAKGYQDCVAFVDETGVRVVVKGDSLESKGVAQIKDIVVEKTGVRASEIKISTKSQ